MIEDILNKLKIDEFCELESKDSCLTIYYRRYFHHYKEFHFVLNAKPIYGCKMPKTAKSKIETYLNSGFSLIEE